MMAVQMPKTKLWLKVKVKKLYAFKLIFRSLGVY